MAWAGAAYAGYGIFSLLVEPRMILWRGKTAYVGNLTGTFINRNTAATYFGSCAAVWLVLLMESVTRQVPMLRQPTLDGPLCSEQARIDRLAPGLEYDSRAERRAKFHCSASRTRRVRLVALRWGRRFSPTTGSPSKFG